MLTIFCICLYHHICFSVFDGFRQAVPVEVPISVSINSDVALECDVLPGNPPPFIEWLRDGVLLEEVMMGNEVRFLDGRRYLFLRGLDSTDVASTYSCRVNNTNLSRIVNAPTTYRLVANLTEPLIDYKPIGNLTAFIGDDVEFAYVGGSPNRATRNILFFRPNGGDEEETGTNLANIGIISADRLSPGMFTLRVDVAFSSPDSPVDRLGRLTVYRESDAFIPCMVQRSVFKTHTPSERPLITSSPSDNREIVVGEGRRSFTCDFVGSPTPDIEWYFNGQPISLSSGVSTAGNTLTIASPDVSNSGIYQCIVSNRFGDDQRAWLLEIRPSSELLLMRSWSPCFYFSLHPPPAHPTPTPPTPLIQSYLKCSHTTSRPLVHLRIETLELLLCRTTVALLCSRLTLWPTPVQTLPGASMAHHSDPPMLHLCIMIHVLKQEPLVPTGGSL